MAATLSVKTIMASFPAYGGSVQGLAANELAMSAEERAAHEAVLHDYIAQHNAQQQQARQAQQDAEQRRQFDVGQTERQAERARIAGNQTEQNALGRDYFNLQKQQVERQMKEQTPAEARADAMKERIREFAHKGAEIKSRSGVYGSPSDVQREFPSLTPEEAASYAAQSLQVRAPIQQRFELAKKVAAAKNLMVNPPDWQNMLDQESQRSWNPDNYRRNPGDYFFRSNHPDTGAMQEWQAAKTKLEQAKAWLSGAKRAGIDSFADFNADTGMHEPAPDTIPPWMTQTMPASPLPATTTTTQQPTATSPAMPAGTGTVTNAPATPVPLDPTRRQRGMTYVTPRGPMTWTGTGWIAP